MPRSLSQAALAHILDPHLDIVVLELIEIMHEDMDEPIRIVNDTQNLDWTDPVTGTTQTYYGWPFELTFPDEGDRAPQGQITVQNVSPKIGEFLRTLHTSPRVRIVVVPEDDTSDIWLDYNYIWLHGITGNAQFVTGTLGPREQVSRPWPKGRATERDFPALFR